MIEQIVFFILGLVALTVGAELLVRGAARLALTWGISPLVVGLTVVAFGTSAPEMAVSAGAVLKGSGNLAIGNVVGSNIANVLLILGLSALIVPLAVADQVIRQEIPIMLGASVLMVVLALDGRIGVLDGAMLFGLILVYVYFLVTQSRRAGAKVQQEIADELPSTDSRWDAHWSMQLMLVVGGLSLLVLGADRLVQAAVAVARTFGISDLVIGLTVVAVGTSMPEIATSLVAAWRGQRDIAIGNVVGSNVFNIFACLGFAALISGEGIVVSETARQFDLWVMLAVAFACLPIMMTGHTIDRWEGGLFIGYYVAYTTYLVLAAQQHAWLASYSQTMIAYLLPLTVIMLLIRYILHVSSSSSLPENHSASH